MIATVGIFPLIFSIPEYLLSHLPYSKIPENLLSSLMTVFVVSALSVAYKLIQSNSKIEDIEKTKDEYQSTHAIDAKSSSI